MKPADHPFVQSVERALDILNCFSHDEQEQSISDIAKKLKLPKSTISRLLTTLRSKHYIEQDAATQRYRLGFRLYDLGNVYAAGMDLRKLAFPLMKELNEKTAETVNLNIVENGERVCIEKIETLYHIRNFVKIGERSSLCYGASGNVLLAYLPEKEAKQIMDKAILTGEEAAVLQETLRTIRSNGYSITIANRIEGVIGLSAPIFDSSGQLAGGLSISGPLERLSSKKEALVKELTLTASMISSRMGYNIARHKNGFKQSTI